MEMRLVDAINGLTSRLGRLIEAEVLVDQPA